MFQIRLQYVCAFQSAVNPQHILIRSQKLARLLILPRVRHTDKTLKTAPGNADLKQLKPLCHFLGLLCAAHLDGDYAVFGYVTDGMDIVDKICEDTKVTDRNGTVAKENQPVIESIEVVD